MLAVFLTDSSLCQQAEEVLACKDVQHLRLGLGLDILLVSNALEELGRGHVVF
jgi:hypothetical protein